MKIKKEHIGKAIHWNKRTIVLDDIMSERDFNIVVANFPNYVEQKKKKKSAVSDK